MIIKFGDAFENSEAGMFEYIESADRPIVIMNKSLTVVARNSLAAKRFPELKTGTEMFGRFGASLDTVFDLLPGQAVCAEITVRGKLRSATVVGGSNKRIILFDSLETRIEKTLFDTYGRMSGYDLILEYPSGAEYETSVLEKKIEGDGADFLFKALSERRKTGGFNVFNAGGLFFAAVSELGEENFRFVSKNRELLAFGRERDFAIVAAFLLSFFKRYSKNEKPLIRTETDSESVVFGIKGEIMPEKREVESLFDLKNPSIMLSDGLSDERYWLYLVKLLAESNLWDLRTEFDGNVFSVETVLPAAEQKTHCVLRDREIESAASALALFR